jgi:type I restriction enzyme S subunit
VEAMSGWKETEIGNIPIHWKISTIGQIGDVTKLAGFEYTSHFSYVNDGEIIALRALNVRDGVLDLSDVKKIYKKISDELPRSKLFKNDILFTYVGANIGQFALITQNDKYHLAPNICRIRCSEQYDPYFLYSYFRSTFFKESLDGFSHGSSQPTMPMGSIRQIPVPFPPLPEQRAIAEVLSSLDDKIDLLHRQNKTLEAMAEALFRQWFVELCRDELPEEWKIVNLSDIAEVQNGYSFSSNDYIGCNEAVLEVLKMGHIEKGGGLRANPKRNYVPKDEKLSKYILNKNDIVMAMTDMKDNVVILGVPALVDKSNHYVLNQRVARIFLRSNELLVNNYLLYIQLKDPENIAVLQSKANGGVQVNLTTQTIKDIQIIVPSMNFQIENAQILVEIYSNKEANHSQIHTLEKLRDILLPKLMSGEVKVEENNYE